MTFSQWLEEHSPHIGDLIESMIITGTMSQCEECDLWVPKEDICYLAGIQKELCSECASDHGSEDWK